MEEDALVIGMVIIVDGAADESDSVLGSTLVAVDTTNVVTSGGLEPVEIDAVLPITVVSVRYVVIAAVM